MSAVPFVWDVVEPMEEASPAPSAIDPRVRLAIVSALTEYDIRASKRKDYNRWALGHYFRALEDVDDQVARGIGLMDALERAFTGRLHDCVAKAARSAIEKSGIRA